VADELRENFGIEAKQVEGRGGIFEVAADGKIVFSKKATGRFPNNGEVTTLLKTLLPASSPGRQK